MLQTFTMPDIANKVGPARLLVIEDDDQIAELFQRILEDAGYRVQVAPDGEDGLERFRRAQSDGDPYQLVVLDCSLPGMDGLEAMGHIHDLDSQARVVLTTGGLLEAADLPQDTPRPVDLLLKPVSLPILLRTVQKALGS